MEDPEKKEKKEKTIRIHGASYLFKRPVTREERKRLAEEAMMHVKIITPIRLTPDQIDHYRQFLMKEANTFMEGPPDMQLYQKRRAYAVKKEDLALLESLDNDPYYREYKEDQDDQLEDSLISAQGSQIQHRAMGRVHGTLWTAHEKAIFFEFLGRYGITQLDKIQQRLVNKTTTQIMCYYNLLQRELEHVKSKKTFTELMRYDEMPEAVEVHPLIIQIEEDISTRTDIKTQSYKPKQLKDDLVDMEVMKDQYFNFLSVPHPKFTKSVQMRLNRAAFREIRRVIKQTTDVVVKRILKTKIHGEMKKPDREATIESGVLTYTVSQNDVYKAVVQCGLKRPFIRECYFQDMDDRLSFQVVDEELPKSGKLDEFDRDKGQFVGIPLEPWGHKRRKTLVENKLHTGDVAVDYRSVYPEQKDTKTRKRRGEFIDDDYREDIILDNPVAWYMLMKEAEDIDKEHDSMKELYGEALLERMGMSHEFKKKLPDYQDRYNAELSVIEKRYKRYLSLRHTTMFTSAHGSTFEEKVEYLMEKHGESREVLTDHQLFITRGQEGTLAQVAPMIKDKEKCEKKTTEDMMLAFNYTFASY